MNQRIAKFTRASRIRRRSWTMPSRKPGEHQPHRYFGIDPRAAIVGTIEFRDLRPQPTQIEDPIDAYQDVVIREQFSQ